MLSFKQKVLKWVKNYFKIKQGVLKSVLKCKFPYKTICKQEMVKRIKSLKQGIVKFLKPILIMKQTNGRTIYYKHV